MICSKCGSELPDNSNFCFHCGMKLFPCRYCKRPIPNRSNFCQYCGAKRPFRSPHKSQTVKTIIILVLSLCIIVGLLAGIHYTSYRKSEKLCDRKHFTEAMDQLFLPGLTRLYDKSYVDYLRAGIEYENGDYDAAWSMLIELPGTKYRDSLILLEYATNHKNKS